MEELLNRQSTDLLHMMGADEQQIEAATAFNRECYQLLRDVEPRKGPDEETKQALQDILERSLAVYTPELLKEPGSSRSLRKKIFRRLRMRCRRVAIHGARLSNLGV